MAEFKNNSFQAKKETKEERERPQSVVTKTAKTKKKSELSKFKSSMISDDAGNVKSYIMSEVFIPAAKKLIADIVTNGIDIILYGETGHSRRTSGASRVSYGKMYDERRDAAPRRDRSPVDYDDIVYDTRGDAEAVLDGLGDIIETYGHATVGDLYDLSGITTNNYVVNKYGWTNIASADVIRAIGGGFMIRLPKARLID